MAGAPLELIAVEVRADLDQLQQQMPRAAQVVDQSMDQVGRSVVRAEQQVARSSVVIGRSFDNAAQRSRLLGYQISDIGTQLASGASPFLVLAQQGPQVANALEGVGGVAGRLAAFFSGPWGAALLAATTIAGGLVAKLWETEDAAEAAAKGARELAAALERIGNLDFTGADIDKLMKEANRLGEEASALERRANSIDPTGRSGFGSNLRQQARELRQERDALLREARNAMDPNNPAVRILQENRARMNERPDRDRGRSDAERAAERAAREAQREAERREREQKALDDRYGKSLEQLTLERQLSELRDRGTDAARLEADLLESNFRIAQQFPELANSTAVADRLRLQLLQQIAAATIEEAHGRRMAKEELDRWFEEAEKRQREQRDQREKAEREAHQLQEQRIRTLGQLYYDAFRGGTEAIWDNFRDIGLAVIAEVLARFTLAKMSGGGFNFGDALGAAIGAVLPGFASGGSMILGGRGGIDRNVLALNGQPIARVSSGEELSIRNPALSSGGGTPTVVQQTFVLDARYGITTPELIDYVNRTAQGAAMQVGGVFAQGVLKRVPGRMAQFQRDGT